MSPSPAPPPQPRFRAPPPTPIKTAKGLKSAAIDDAVLADYLETSLTIPSLVLPSRSPAKTPLQIALSSLISENPDDEIRIYQSVREVGAVRVSGPVGGVGEAILAGKGVLAGKEKREGMERWFGGREGVEEMYWFRLRSEESERSLRGRWPEIYPDLCEKMEELAGRLEIIADCIAKILSKHVKNQTSSKRIGKVQSILCLRKYDSHYNRDCLSDISDFKSLHSHALSLHVCSEDREFCIRRPEGSSFFRLPAGSVLVTIGKPLQEWCNGEIKSAAGEIVLEPSYDPVVPVFALEYMCSPPALSPELGNGAAKISIMDQLLIFLALAFLYNLWSMFFSSSSKI